MMIERAPYFLLCLQCQHQFCKSQPWGGFFPLGFKFEVPLTESEQTLPNR